MAEQNSKSAKPRRRWFRYSLRTLFVVMTIAAVWLGLTMKRIRDQERGVARILELDGYVRYDYQVDANGKVLIELNLNLTSVDDDGLTHLTGLTNLSYLFLSGPNVTNESVAKLREALPNTTIVGP